MSEAHDSPQPEVKPGDSSAKLIGIMALSGLLSGLLLVSTYMLTRDQIAASKAETLKEAVFRVVPGATDAKPFERSGTQLRPYQAPAGESKPPPLAWAGYDKDGKLLGYALPGEGPGFADTIKVLYGYDPARKVIVGMEVLESRETPGLGDKIYLDKPFQENFKALQVEPELKAVKHGHKVHPNEVDCITGATISSKAVTRILDTSVKEWKPALEPKPPAMPTAALGGGKP